jgi:hypothetical protein
MLDGGPLETAPAAKKPEDDNEIEMKGEFYPVLIQLHKHRKQWGARARHPRAWACEAWRRRYNPPPRSMVVDRC